MWYYWGEVYYFYRTLVRLTILEINLTSSNVMMLGNIIKD